MKKAEPRAAARPVNCDPVVAATQHVVSTVTASAVLNAEVNGKRAVSEPNPSPNRPLNLTKERMHYGLAVRGIDSAIALTMPFAMRGISGGEIEAGDAMAELAQIAMRVKDDGDLSDLETTLAMQAMSLNALAGELLLKAAGLIDRPNGTLDLYLRLGLKAQNQARMTVQSLAEIRNPRPVLIAKQANVAQQQQVNSGPQPQQLPQPSRTKRIRDEADRTIGTDE